MVNGVLLPLFEDTLAKVAHQRVLADNSKATTVGPMRVLLLLLLLLLQRPIQSCFCFPVGFANGVIF